MRYFSLLCLGFLSLFPSMVSGAVLQGEGFQQFSPQGAGSPTLYHCQSTCVVVLGTPTGDKLDFSLTASGAGIVAYGVVSEQKIISLWEERIEGQKMIDEKSSLGSSPSFSVLKTLPFVFIFQGDISGSIGKLAFRQSTSSERMSENWRSFWQWDPFGPATINLLTGPKIAGKNANNLFHFLFFMGAIILIVLMQKGRIIPALIVFASVLWIIYDIRMSGESLSNAVKDIQALKNDTPLRDRGNFYHFIDFARSNLDTRGVSSTGTVSFYSDNTWPFPGSTQYFLYPRKVLLNTPSSTFIVYGYSGVTHSSSGVSISGEMLESGSIDVFSPGAFISSHAKN